MLYINIALFKKNSLNYYELFNNNDGLIIN
jgi:hypothetical protein